MNKTLKVLDLFCGAGGAGDGFVQAHCDVTGVDIINQPNYPAKFIKADWKEMIGKFNEYDFIWASPVCKRYSSATRTSKTALLHPDQIAEVRQALKENFNGSWCIENVAGAPLDKDMTIMLCGTMFGLPLYRHRFIETSHYISQPEHKDHSVKVLKMGRKPNGTEIINPVGHFSGVKEASKAMGIDWMTRDELSQAIPPAYSLFIVQEMMGI